MNGLEKPILDRNYDLSNDNDRSEFISSYESYLTSIIPIQTFNEIIDFLIKHLGDNWVNVYSLGTISIKTGDKLSRGMDFFKYVLPFGFNLLELQNLNGFESILRRLHTPTLIESTILEINSAARYRKSGYEIELEPLIEGGKCADFKVNFMGEWIYFECKKEHMEVSKYYINYNKYASEIMNELNQIYKDELNDEFRIDVVFHKRLPRKYLTGFYSEIRNVIKKKSYKKWIMYDDVEFAINNRMDFLNFQPQPVKLASMIVSDKPTRLSDENAHLRLFFNPFGNKEIQKIRRILKEAKNQIPKTHRGIIILEVNHTEKMVSVVEEKINRKGYEHIIVVLVVGNGAWLVPNKSHKDFPKDFVSIAVKDS